MPYEYVQNLGYIQAKKKKRNNTANISGNYFGEPHQSSENSNIRITIAGSECEVIDWQQRRVQCRTKPVEKEVSGIT